MLSKFVNKVFPCEKVINNILDMHSEAMSSNIASAQRLRDACEQLDGKMCITQTYNGNERRSK